MIKTYNKTGWNQNTQYHSERMVLVDQQVKKYLLPTVLKNYTPGPISVADFACGGGGIARSMIEHMQNEGYVVKQLVLIDVVSDNLQVAKKLVKDKFPDLDIQVFLCNGLSFEGFDYNSVDFLYCWDAMVHFDVHDIAGYLRTLNKVVHGAALFHHSNFDSITYNVVDNPGWRNFMTKTLFHQLAISVGHTVLEQHLMDWPPNLYPSLDCVTVLQTRVD